MKWSQQPAVRKKWPELKLLHHIANERKDRTEAVILSRLGVKKGVPDLCLPVARGGYHGLYIEMKNEKGRASTEQKWWVEELTGQNYRAIICHGWQEAVKELEGYLNGDITL